MKVEGLRHSLPGSVPGPIFHLRFGPKENFWFLDFHGRPPSYAARFVGVNDNRKEFTTYCIIPRPDRPMREEAMRTTTTREMRTNEVYRAAVIFGIISDYSPESIFKVEKILKEQLAAGKIVKRKDGASRTSPAWYAAKIPNDPRWSRHD